MKYDIKIIHDNTKTHQLVEAWRKLSKKRAKIVLLDALDALRGRDGEPREPSLEALKKNLAPLAGMAYARKEYRRMKKALEIYRQQIRIDELDRGSERHVWSSAEGLPSTIVVRAY